MPIQYVVTKLNSSYKTFRVFQTMNSAIIKSYFTNDLITLKKKWASTALKVLNIETKVIGAPRQSGPLLLLGNHISYLDIPLIMAVAPQVSFLSKQELKRWPIIGPAAKKAHTIFVKRGCAESRSLTRQIIEDSLSNEKALIAAFPAGTTTMNETISWRHGLFHTAHSKKIKIQPFRIHYSTKRTVAYIDDDRFFPHLFKLSHLKKIHAVIEFHEPVDIVDPVLCSLRWQTWTQENIHLTTSDI